MTGRARRTRVTCAAGWRPRKPPSWTDTKEATAMYESSTRASRQAPTGARLQIVKRRRIRRDLPELDLRTPSGKRTLPY